MGTTNLQFIDAYAGLGGVSESLHIYCEPKSAVHSTRLRTALWNKAVACEEQPIKKFILVYQGCSRVSGNHVGGANSVSQIDGDSDLVSSCACMLGGGKSQENNNGTCQYFHLHLPAVWKVQQRNNDRYQDFCLGLFTVLRKNPTKEQWHLPILLSWRKLTLQPWHWSQTIHFLPLYPWYFMSFCPFTGA